MVAVTATTLVVTVGMFNLIDTIMIHAHSVINMGLIVLLLVACSGGRRQQR